MYFYDWNFLVFNALCIFLKMFAFDAMKKKKLKKKQRRVKNKIGMCWYRCSLKMINRQTRMAASAPMLSFSVCPSCMSSQFAPQKPSGQLQLYRNVGSKLMHWAPFMHGRSKHSLRSMQLLPSGVMTRPSPQLYITYVGVDLHFIFFLVLNATYTHLFFSFIYGGWTFKFKFEQREL